MGECFTNRGKEISELKHYILAAQNVFMYSKRRLGKTSLIKTVLEELSQEKETIAIYVDIQQATSMAQFLEIYSQAISKALITWKEKMEKIASFFSRITPIFEIRPDGQWKVTFDFSKARGSVDRALEEVYELPQKIARSYKKRVVVVFDEFQEVSRLNGEGFEKKLRSFIQHHHEVCYIFTGSKTHIIMQMFADPNRAFYKSAEVYPLEPIPADEMIAFIIERFAVTSKSISENLAKEIIQLSKNSPYHVQMLCWHVWLAAEKGVSQTDIQVGLEEIIHHQNELFYTWYDSVSLSQRAVLRTLARTNQIFSQETILNYNLGSISTVQASIRSLVKNGLVDKDKKGYSLVDPFFQIWLERNT
ncbi:MAG: ATP-binding protein [bacterium]